MKALTAAAAVEPAPYDIRLNAVARRRDLHASPSAGHITGIPLPVDGGYTAR
jgi:hypothetical protein